MRLVLLCRRFLILFILVVYHEKLLTVSDAKTVATKISAFEGLTIYIDDLAANFHVPQPKKLA